MSFSASALLLAVAMGGCTRTRPPTAGFTEPIIERRSDMTGREHVSLTLYNQDLGLVREVRNLELGQGRVSLTFADVTTKLRPETVHLRTLEEPSALTVFEQNYRYDLLTGRALLEKYVGKHIRIARYDARHGRDEVADAEVLSVNTKSDSAGEPPSVVLRVGGEIVSGTGYRFLFPGVPPNLVSEPSLVWLLGSSEAHQRVEVSYLTNGFSWQADYVLTLAEDNQHGDLNGWVTLENESGASFRSATLKLVAGNVHQVLDPELRAAYYGALDAARPTPALELKEEKLFEYHLYTLGRPTDVLNHEKKQVGLLEAHGVRVKKKLRYRGPEQWFNAERSQSPKRRKVSAVLEFRNSAQNNLGEPLPKGTVRVYKERSDGAVEFVGEDSIDHTPRDEPVEVELGQAFDVLADQTVKKITPLTPCKSEIDWEIVLRNHKGNPEHIEVEQPLNGGYTLLASEPAAKNKESFTLGFDVDVPAHGERKITFRVRVGHYFQPECKP